MPCDRIFGTIKRSVRKHDRIYCPKQYKELICNAKNIPPRYIVTDITIEHSLNFRDWWALYFKKTTTVTIPGQLPTKVPFTISKYKHNVFKQEEKSFVRCSEFIDSPVVHKFKLTKGSDAPVPNIRAYVNKIPIKKKNIDDVEKILQYIPQEYFSF